MCKAIKRVWSLGSGVRGHGSGVRRLRSRGQFSAICILHIAFLSTFFVSGCDLNSFPEDPVPTVPVSVAADLTLRASISPYRMNGYSVVEPGVTLRMEPGTTVIVNTEGCETGNIGSCGALIVAKGGRIEAEGTAEDPIVFTTERERAGEWLGIVINGNAPCNTGADTDAVAGTGLYCGNNEADDSGILNHVIIEYAGAAAIDSAWHQPAALSLNGVGSGTQIEYVHALDSDYNGYAMIGGTVDLKRALATCASENGFAWHDGWRGRGQFWIAQQCETGADSGIYGANVTLDVPDLDRLPRSHPTVYNFSLLGPPEQDTGREGIELERGSGGLLGNGIVYNHRTKGFWINDRESCDYVLDGSIRMRHVYFANNDRDFSNRCGENNLFLTEEAGNVIGESNFFQDPFNPMGANLMLNSEGAAFPADSQIPSEWFESVDYVGGMGDVDWTVGLRESG